MRRGACCREYIYRGSKNNNNKNNNNNNNNHDNVYGAIILTKVIAVYVCNVGYVTLICRRGVKLGSSNAA